jgi:ribonuclease MRP protein subunit RMP1
VRESEKESKGDEANLSRAFSNLVADNQYSALGLVLVGCLARVKSAIRQLVEDEKVEGVDLEAEVERDVVMELETGENERQDDLGEVVDRREIFADLEGLLDVDELAGDELEMLEEQIAPEATEETQRVAISKQGKKKRTGPLMDRDESLRRETATPSKPPKKKRKKGDAFDDLFSSLI